MSSGFFGGIGRAFVADAARPALLTLVAGSAITGVMGAIEALWPVAGAPDLRTWLGVLALASVGSWSLVLPAAAAAGAVGALGRWVEEGAWDGARAAGRSGRQLLPAVLAIAVIGAASAGLMSLWGEPAARRQAGALQRDAVATVALHPDRELAIDGLVLRPRRATRGAAEEVFIARGDVVGSAARATVHRSGEVLVLALEDGVLVGSGPLPWRLSWGRWERELPLRGRRTELVERSGAELAAAARRTEADGRDASYEWSVLYKRYTHPLGALLFPVAVLPLAAGRRRAIAAGLVGVGALVAMRAGDHLSFLLGPGPAAGSGPLFLVFVAAFTWWRWGDR